jgi:hypothetical protein
MRPISDLAAKQAERRERDPLGGGEAESDRAAEDRTPSPTEDLTALLVQSVRVAVGAFVAAGAVGTEIVRRTLGQESGARTEEAGPPFPVLATGAALGFAVETATRTASALTRTARAFAPWGSWLVSATGVRAPVRREAERLNARWGELSPVAQEAAAAFARELVPEVTRALLDQLDLAAVVEERVDLERIVGGLDLDAVASRIDLDRIVQRVDVGAIVDRLDLDAIASKIDVDAIVARVDLEAAVRRLDTAQLAREVIEELDLAALIRESTESVTSEAVGDLRYGAVDADRAIARAVDRIFRRRNRSIGPSEPPGDTSDPAP